MNRHFLESSLFLVRIKCFLRMFCKPANRDAVPKLYLRHKASGTYRASFLPSGGKSPQNDWHRESLQPPDAADGPIQTRGKPFLRFAESKLNQIRISRLAEQLPKPLIELPFADAEPYSHFRQSNPRIGKAGFKPRRFMFKSSIFLYEFRLYYIESCKYRP